MFCDASRLPTFIGDVGPTPPVFSFSRPAWVKLNSLQTGVGLFCSQTHKWGMASMTAWKCGAKEQTAEHIITSCPIYHHPNLTYALLVVKKPGGLADGNMSIRAWLLKLWVATPNGIA